MDWTIPSNLYIIFTFQLCLNQSTESGPSLKPDVSLTHQMNESKFEEKKVNGGNDSMDNVCAIIHPIDSYEILRNIAFANNDRSCCLKKLWIVTLAYCTNVLCQSITLHILKNKIISHRLNKWIYSIRTISSNWMTCVIITTWTKYTTTNGVARWLHLFIIIGFDIVIRMQVFFFGGGGRGLVSSVILGVYKKNLNHLTNLCW